MYKKIDIYVKNGSTLRYMASTRQSRTLKDAEARFLAAYPQYRNERIKAFRTGVQ